MTTTTATTPTSTGSPQTTPPRDWREGRRLRGLELHERGWSGARIAEALGVTPGAVSQWLKRAREGGGREALRHRPPPGKAPKLTAEQRVQLPEVLGEGAEAHGFVGEVWTTPRVATMIAREFGVQHHPSHVSRILRAIGWTPQKPVRRATQRDEAAIEAWREERWPDIKAKVPKQTGRSSLWTNQPSISSPSSPAPMPHAGRRPPCACP